MFFQLDLILEALSMYCYETNKKYSWRKVSKTTDENIVGKVVFIANWTAPFLQNAVINGSLNYARLILGSLVIVALLFIILTAFFVLVEILIILIKNIMEVNRHGIQQKE